MTHTEIAAYIGAAAWLPIVATWAYKRFVTPNVTIVSGEIPEIGFTTFGPIINLRMAITAERKPAIVDSFSLKLTHKDGGTHLFHWAGMTEDVNQIVDSTGTRQRIEKEQTAIAFHVGVESMLEKFVRFQDRSFGEATQPVVDAISEQVHFAMKKEAFSVDEFKNSKEYDDLKRTWERKFPWKAGQYTGEFEISSPTKVSLSQTRISFVLTDTDIEILKRNIEVNGDYTMALVKSIQDGTEPPQFQWSWRYPRIQKIRS